MPCCFLTLVACFAIARPFLSQWSVRAQSRPHKQPSLLQDGGGTAQHLRRAIGHAPAGYAQEELLRNVQDGRLLCTHVELKEGHHQLHTVPQSLHVLYVQSSLPLLWGGLLWKLHQDHLGTRLLPDRAERRVWTLRKTPCAQKARTKGGPSQIVAVPELGTRSGQAEDHRRNGLPQHDQASLQVNQTFQ